MRAPRRGWQTAGAALAVAAAALAACAGSPPIRYHALTPVAPAGAARAAYDGPVVEVGIVQLPPALARQELLREVGPGEYQVRESDHWAAPLAQLVRQALAEDLVARLPPGKVAVPGAAWPPMRASVDVAVLSFRVSGGTAMATLAWSLRPRAAPGATPPIAPRGAQIELSAPADGTAEGTAAAWNGLLGQLADRVVVDLAAPAAR